MFKEMECLFLALTVNINAWPKPSSVFRSSHVANTPLSAVVWPPKHTNLKTTQHSPPAPPTYLYSLSGLELWDVFMAAETV